MVQIKFSEDFNEQPALIKVIGLGGAGGNAVNRMIESGLSHVEFIAANTDSQALRRNRAPVRLQLGERITKGLGVGGNPILGRQATEESRDRIREVLTGADMVFITAGMGGGTGTGSAPVVAQIARELDPKPLVVAVVTRPFDFEGQVRKNQGDQGIEELRPHVDTMLAIPNDRLFDIIDESTTSLEAFRTADNVLRQAVQAITDVITRHGLINVDFADVRSIMSGAGEALMGMGESHGEGRALSAAKMAVQSPLLENLTIDGAKGLLVNISGNKSITLFEVKTAMDFIKNAASADAHVFYGQVFDDALEERFLVTVIATGFPPARRASARRTGARPTAAPESVRAVAFRAPAGDAPLLDDDLRRPAYLRRKVRKLT
ncbi:MAG: cell division protein FtsZ [Elusimicrobia bacterium]|jgi:cell division protein FtsZ|nr:cell division protein FtsZ [Elusimicrobiota bacterium]MBK7207465.1 cell division protein FtsZ [Elusimicrobiota bacterium]MBK7573757.1 cell division protein FtsZ [Elusimicrobiota bacterium]MBK7689355.1 cell division protein FtsZ [Elusimicrobiota bacterium]MBK8422798.1 cell division protein FtsZ [Elusimicrobiota bacterium]